MKKTLRPAIAMIELIFALVIMGITLLSIPLVVSQSSKSSFIAFQQESIAMAASHISAVLTYEWDEGNIGINSGKILNVTSGDVGLNQSVGSVVRGATTQFPNARKRQFVSAATTFFATDTLGIDSNDSVDDIDDFIVEPLSLTINSTTPNNTNEGDYIDTDITISTFVTYANDSATYGSLSNAGFAFSFSPSTITAPAVTTNIKFITVQLTTGNLNGELQNKNITLHAFMCNIGAGRPTSRGGF